jgi:multidrug efflux pump subunit AcrB
VVLAALAGSGAAAAVLVFAVLVPWLRSYFQPQPRPVITIEAEYPGANAQEVADTVAAPIEQQVIGVENMVHLRSQCTHEGKYTLHVTFAPGVNLDLAQVLVQNRVSLALPMLPDAVKLQGVAVKKKSPGVLMIVAVTSQEGHFDALYLSKYATTQLKDELARVTGVSEIQCLGQRDHCLRVWLDPNRLEARQLAVIDVVQALREQNVDVEAGRLGAGAGQNLPISLNLQGRLPDMEKLHDIVLKTGAAGQTVRLRDVGQLELGASQTESHVSINGKPSVLLCVFPTPATRASMVSAAVRDKLTQLGAECPAGVQVDIAFDFTPNLEAWRASSAPQHILLNLTLPPGASTERAVEVLNRCESILRNIEGVQDTLALTENPFDPMDGQACILARLARADHRLSSREQVIQTIRARLDQEIAEAVVRLRDLSGPSPFPTCAFPLDLCCHGPERARLVEWSEHLAERLRQSQKLTDLGVSPGARPQPQLELDIDRARAKDLGVSTNDISTTLQTFLGALNVNDLHGFGRTWQVKVQTDLRFRLRPDDLKQLKVRNSQGQMVPLGALISVREIMAPTLIERLNGEPMVEITGNLASGVPAGEARSLCEKLAEEARQELRLPPTYRLTWQAP